MIGLLASPAMPGPVRARFSTLFTLKRSSDHGKNPILRRQERGAGIRG